MVKPLQLALFEDFSSSPVEIKTARSGSFVDNMALPVHRWFRYSAGFSAEWVEGLLHDWGLGAEHRILDPFASSGTVGLACDKLGLTSLAIEAHPTVARICQAKLSWMIPVEPFLDLAEQVLQAARLSSPITTPSCPDLLQRSFTPAALAGLNALKLAWQAQTDQSPAAELVWLAITAILRSCSHAGTAQWQYILPNKTKKSVLAPETAFRQQVGMMAADMRWMQAQAQTSRAAVFTADARRCAELITAPVDVVITSPPYANNYDYADALRFEMTFWGEVEGWGDIHAKVRNRLIVSSSQHASKERLVADELLAAPLLAPIRTELAQVVEKLALERESHGGKKHYHTMIPGYCRDIALVLQGLRRVCQPGAHMCWVIGDSAPYGVYCPIDQWIGELALAQGFKAYRFEKLRDRNVKWENRKHRVPLKEGLLWIEG
jgi:hypothetical protein